MGYFDSIPQRIQSTMQNFDRNKNGTLDYCLPKKPCDVQDEKTQVSTQRLKDEKGREYTHEVTWKLDKLMLGADHDKNGRVTPGEIEGLMKKFDKDGDNVLPTRGLMEYLTFKPKKEGDKFEDAHGLDAKTRAIYAK